MSERSDSEITKETERERERERGTPQLPNVGYLKGILIRSIGSHE
jgi:hypothetical protein